MKIVIPTYKRTNNVQALVNVRPEVQSKYYWLAVRDEEAEEYKKNYPDVNIKILPNVSNVRETRQRVNEVFDGVIVVIDDDVSFCEVVVEPKEYYKEHANGGGILRPGNILTSLEDYDAFAECIEETSEKYPFGGIRSLHFPRPSSWLPLKENITVIWAVFFNLDKFDCHKYSYSKGPIFIEDIFLCVSYFQDHDLGIITKYGIKKKASTGGQEGGCQTSDRYLEHNKSAVWLAHNFPNMCKLKHSNLNSRTMGGPCLTTTQQLTEKKKNSVSLFDEGYTPYESFDPSKSIAYLKLVEKTGREYEFPPTNKEAQVEESVSVQTMVE